MDRFWDRFFDYLEKYLPGLLVAFGLGHRLSQNKVREAQRIADEAKLAAEKARNKAGVMEAARGLTYADIVDQAIKRGEDQGG